MSRYLPGHRVKLSHPTKGDPVGSHSHTIKDKDACHFYVIDNVNGNLEKVRLDAVLDWPGVNYEQSKA